MKHLSAINSLVGINFPTDFQICAGKVKGGNTCFDHEGLFGTLRDPYGGGAYGGQGEGQENLEDKLR